MNYNSKYNSPLGELLLTSDGDYLTGIWFPNYDKKVYEDYLCVELDIFKKVKRWLDDYFNKKKPCINDIPMKLEGTDFSKRVWDSLKNIPYGETVSYKYISDIIAKEKNMKAMSCQAIGRAIGKNPIPIIIPCHRVVGKDNKLVGYGGGLDIKIKLLLLEGLNISKFSGGLNDTKK